MAGRKGEKRFVCFGRCDGDELAGIRKARIKWIVDLLLCAARLFHPVRGDTGIM